MKLFQYFLVASFCLIAFPSFAQFSLGIKGGFGEAHEDYGDVDLPEDADIDIASFNVAAIAYYSFNPYFSVGVEPGYARRGAACIPGWEPIFTGDTKLLFDYAELPLMAMGRLPIKQFEIFAKIGYGAAYMLKAVEEVDNIEDPDSPFRTDIDFSNPTRINRWDHGLYGGVGVGYNYKIHQIFLVLDHYRANRNADRTTTSKNRSLNLNLGYQIRL